MEKEAAVAARGEGEKARRQPPVTPRAPMSDSVCTCGARRVLVLASSQSISIPCTAS